MQKSANWGAIFKSNNFTFKIDSNESARNEISRFVWFLLN